MKDNQAKYPQLRFKGFTDPWEERKFKDNIVSIQTGTNLLGSAVNEGTPLIKMGNLQRGYFSFKKLEYLDSNSNVGSEDIVNYGDFLFNTRNTLELVGKGATWTGISGKYAFNSNIARFKFDGIDTIFFNYLYNTQQVISQVHARAVGTTSVSAVYPRDLNSLLYYLPSIEEQQKIGSFFKQLDDTITLHQRKLAMLKELKQGYLQKLFPKNGSKFPQLRFAGFADAWEQRKLEDISSVITKGTTPKDKSWRGEVNYVKTESIDSNSGNISVMANTSLEEHEGYLKRSQLQDGDVLFTIVGTLGRIGVVKNKDLPANTNQQIAIIRLNNANNRFVFHALKTSRIASFIKSDATIGAQPSLSLWQINGLKIPYPSLKEQDKIGGFFEHLDHLITLHQRKLEKLQELKKGYLQKMFC
ncbi:restriction endonuclease subunit S [Lactiplantibacillus pentosus]|uniref:restriction endonuclease subunit S n=1 Tax=Lactiplantibacillus pentosus TaxID=1589 RepID=UPI001F616FB9|nr:restriction endonuclease subunit S [Lactiplantibacillus pentosus]